MIIFFNKRVPFGTLDGILKVVVRVLDELAGMDAGLIVAVPFYKISTLSFYFC